MGAVVHGGHVRRLQCTLGTGVWQGSRADVTIGYDLGNLLSNPIKFCWKLTTQSSSIQSSSSFWVVLYVLLFKCVPYSKCVSCHQRGAHRRVNIINQDCQVSVKIFSSTTFQKLQALLQAIPPSLSLGLTVVTESTKKPTKAGWHYEDTAETHHALPAGSASSQPHTRCYTAQKSWALEKGDTFRHTICYKTICWHLWSMFKLAPSDNAISNCLVRFFSFNNYVRWACMGQKKKIIPLWISINGYPAVSHHFMMSLVWIPDTV